MFIPLKNRAKEIIGYAHIDELDLNLVSNHKWSLDSYGYAVTAWREKGKTINAKMHRVILGASKGQEIDHINRDRLDNRRANLRFVTRSQNNENSKVRVDSLTGIKNIGWDKARNKWRVQIKRDGIKFIKRFENLNQAKKFREAISA